MKPRNAVSITLPVPPVALRPNARVHYHARGRAVKQYRGLARVLARSAMTGTPRWTAATVGATWYFPTQRRRDRDNLLASLKAAFDGLVDAGLLADDSGLQHLPHKTIVERGCEPRVVLTITPQETAP